MTRDHDFKRLVRERAADTGETYMQAREQLLAAAAEVERAEQEVVGAAAEGVFAATRDPATSGAGVAATGEPAPRSGSVALAERRPHDRQERRTDRRRLVLVAHGRVDVRPARGRRGDDDNELLAAGVDLTGSRPLVELDMTDDEIFIEVAGRMEVQLAADFDLVIDAEGRVSVTGATGVVDVVVTNGRIDIEGASPDVWAETGNGQIEVRGGSGRCVAVTRNGRISVDGDFTDVDLETDNGRIEAATVGAGYVRTANGRIDVAVAGPGAAVSVAAQRLTSNATFLGREGSWTATLGADTGRSLVIDARHQVAVTDRTT